MKLLLLLGICVMFLASIFTAGVDEKAHKK
ncbi:hypothetical protein ATL39_2399 [Sinobaca qinghaiensis]|uniref:Uncharacterized protein n=1 Tax=Sinobaca qinghaiensis TaxID=342944 RepID=A0A419V3X4_9BACL|nr:hypothetical protein ATL39_2399 [Sinobaca qinghaiensis]